MLRSSLSKIRRLNHYTVTHQHRRFLESLELPSPLKVCVNLSTQCLIGNTSAKPVLQTASWSGSKLEASETLGISALVSTVGLQPSH